MAQDHSLKEEAVDPSHIPIRKSKSRPTTNPWSQDGAVMGSAQTPLPPDQSVAMGPSVVRPGNPIISGAGQPGTWGTWTYLGGSSGKDEADGPSRKAAL